MTPLQILPKNVRYLGKLIVAKGFKKFPKVQKIAKPGHTAREQQILQFIYKHHNRSVPKLIIFQYLVFG